MVTTWTVQGLLLLFVVVYPAQSDSSSGWSYENPHNWGKNYPLCNGKRQSPIHIKSIKSCTLPLPEITFKNYNVPLAGHVTLKNNGHSVEFHVAATVNGQRPYISGGTLEQKYEAVNVHFHWGDARSKGSEHTIDERRFDMEMHIVHKNVNYPTMEEAILHKDGLAVLGVMFKIVDGSVGNEHSGLNRIFNTLPQVVKYHSHADVEGPLKLRELLADLHTEQYFTYSGSLTTPGCAEAVTWFVFPRPLPIALRQIKKFWSIKDSHGKPLINNYRPLQPCNQRLVFYRTGGYLADL